MARQRLVKNTKQLMKMIEKDIDLALMTDVADSVKETMQESIDENVYNHPDKPAGAPYYYDRRRDSGGLRDVNNMIEKLVQRGVLEVRNDTPPKNPGFDRFLAKPIQKGYGDEEQWYNQPREFIDPTIEKILSDNIHAKSMKEAMIKLGYTVI